ncbi:MAG: TetR/AcrR family transcriptional regulator [Acetobacteraceae bacterium]|nr:TetR/AcrR family transcriptional regulator [Acetobacteraceae bacterium]
MSPPVRIGRPGRPTRDAAAHLGPRILDAATSLFLRHGYAATSMEGIAAAARVSKRTLYKRFPDKAAVLRASLAALIERWLPGLDESLEDASLESALLRAARYMLSVALRPEALALRRLLIAEVARFPEIAVAAREAGSASGITRVAAMLRARGSSADAIWAAEQFQTMVLNGPIDRALGFGEPLDAAAQAAWAQNCVRLFLHGVLPRGAC